MTELFDWESVIGPPEPDNYDQMVKWIRDGRVQKPRAEVYAIEKVIMPASGGARPTIGWEDAQKLTADIAAEYGAPTPGTYWRAEGKLYESGYYKNTHEIAYGQINRDHKWARSAQHVVHETVHAVNESAKVPVGELDRVSQGHGRAFRTAAWEAYEHYLGADRRAFTDLADAKGVEYADRLPVRRRQPGIVDPSKYRIGVAVGEEWYTFDEWVEVKSLPRGERWSRIQSPIGDETAEQATVRYLRNRKYQAEQKYSEKLLAAIKRERKAAEVVADRQSNIDWLQRNNGSPLEEAWNREWLDDEQAKHAKAVENLDKVRERDARLRPKQTGLDRDTVKQYKALPKGQSAVDDIKRLWAFGKFDEAEKLAAPAPPKPEPAPAPKPTPASESPVRRPRRKYPKLSEAVSAGLFHPNCTHTVGYADVDDEDETPDRRPEEYKRQQQQRGLERQARQQKRAELLSKSKPEARQWAMRRAETQRKIRELVADDPYLTRRNERENIVRV